MSELQKYVDLTVEVITSDGRVIVGTFKGFDQTKNVILSSCHERVFSETEEALARYPLESRNGIAQRFRLTKICELATDRTLLLSFMFYIGAISYQLNSSAKHYFQIPNHITERKLFKEALKIYDWKEADLIGVFIVGLHHLISR
ncbi:37794_t:CDS:2 [Gigaspora margarita]|uniref:LSM2-LSM8 complex subunit LSM8 n=1 Tax=Gigaspora margarita TaxID=4874 RepID=A0ABN7V8Z7_GIGMA|nr:37794_t:CDS:2 [Gigaspora margarita]